MESNNSEDFFDFFKDKVVSKTKKFCFKKKVDKPAENDSNRDKEVVTSPFFAGKCVKRVSDQLKETLDNTLPKDSVERQLYNIFNEDDAFQEDVKNSTSSETQNKPLHSSNLNGTVRNKSTISSTSKVKNDAVRPAANKNITIAPVFLFNKEKSNVSQTKNSKSSCASASITKGKNDGRNLKQHQSGKSSSTFKFKKKPDPASSVGVSSSTIFDSPDKSRQSNAVAEKSFSPKIGFTKSQTNNIPQNGICNYTKSNNAQLNYQEAKYSANTENVNSFTKVDTKSQNSPDNSSCSSSPVIKPKKFIFKKKHSISSSSTLSQLCSAHSENNTISSNETPETKNLKAAESPIIISSNESFHKNKKDDPSRQVTEVKKNLFSTINFDDTVSCVSQSLEASQADYMTDEQFEKLFCSSKGIDSNITNQTSKLSASPDEFDLNDIDWNAEFESQKTNSDVLNEVTDINWDEDVFCNNQGDDSLPKDVFSQNVTPKFVGARGDDSSEFKKNYHFSTVMMEVLREKFGLRNFRPHQREVINASLNRHDCFVLMPTGGGKSLCYQLPAILSEGVTIVISPLRALISDQVDKLIGLDIPAAHLCSDVTETDTKQILSKLNMREPGIKLLYVTPEKIVASNKLKDTFESLYKRDKLARFVIDEAHCLSQWGHDFRPDYKQLSLLRRQYATVPIICLTATATKQVETDVINSLKLKNVKKFIRSFNRPNIKYQVLPKSNRAAVQEISNLIKRNFNKKSGIIYCLARKDCETLASNLNTLGIKTKPYHAGMNDKVRENIQREWMQDRFHVIIATIAFGMGIDKPDVRFVIHNSIPKSVEAFYQESGRAGRDGETSYSYLFYNYCDVGRLQKLMQMDRNANKKALDGHMENLKQMVAFAENVVDCRRHLQLLHLGENFDRQICIQSKETTCDNCENFRNYDLADITKEAKELGILVRDLSQRGSVTMFHVADVYRGSKLKKILERGHNAHKYYGAGSKIDRLQVTRILKDLILKGVLDNHHVYTGEFPVVYIKPGSKFNMLNSPDVKLTLPINKNPVASVQKSYPELSSTSTEPGPSSDISTIDKSPASKPAVSKYKITKLKVQCHEELLEECRRLALERNVTLSSIMNLSAIKSMSEALPKTQEEFLKIQHVTVANFKKCGEYFLKITSKYREQVDSLQTVAKSIPVSKSSSFDDDDFCSSSQGVKRKSTGGYKKGAKRYKRNYKTKKTYRKWKTKGGSPKKKAASGKTKGGLGLMPVHFK